jgi:hypothetical protein
VNRRYWYALIAVGIAATAGVSEARAQRCPFNMQAQLSLQMQMQRQNQQQQQLQNTPPFQPRMQTPFQPPNNRSFIPSAPSRPVVSVPRTSTNIRPPVPHLQTSIVRVRTPEFGITHSHSVVTHHSTTTTFHREFERHMSVVRVGHPISSLHMTSHVRRTTELVSLTHTQRTERVRRTVRLEWGMGPRRTVSISRTPRLTPTTTMKMVRAVPRPTTTQKPAPRPTESIVKKPATPKPVSAPKPTVTASLKMSFTCGQCHFSATPRHQDLITLRPQRPSMPGIIAPQGGPLGPVAGPIARPVMPPVAVMRPPVPQLPVVALPPPPPNFVTRRPDGPMLGKTVLPLPPTLSLTQTPTTPTEPRSSVVEITQPPPLLREAGRQPSPSPDVIEAPPAPAESTSEPLTPETVLRAPPLPTRITGMDAPSLPDSAGEMRVPISPTVDEILQAPPLVVKTRNPS